MSITSPKFEDWQQTFRKKSGVISSKIYDKGWQKVPILSAFKKIRDSIEPTVGTHELLERNLLYACFQAQNAIDPDLDSAAKARDEYKLQIRQLGTESENVLKVLNFIQSNRSLVESALKYSADISSKATQALKNSNEIDSPHILESLLIRLGEGYRLMQTPAHPGLLDITIDFAYGPLLFYNNDASTRVFAMGNKPKARELGLIFHLAYIFRYFTGHKEDMHCLSRLNKDGELIINGTMLTYGEPHLGLVAHLFNTTFDKQFDSTSMKKQGNALSGGSVKDRLEYLLDPIKNSKEDTPKLGKENMPPFSLVEFYGWDRNLPDLT